MMTAARMMAIKAAYDGVTVAGLAVIAADTGRCFMAQRALDETDDKDVQETWEWVGGHLEEGEDPIEGAKREFAEEIGFPVPDGEVINGWRSRSDDHYQGFVYQIEAEIPLDGWQPTDEVQAVGWFTPTEAQQLDLRPEFDKFDWSLVYPDDEVDSMEDESMDEPTFSLADLMGGPIPVHGVIAPEEAESGDGRGFSAGAMTSRPYRLPFAWQEQSVPQHDGSVVVGSVDRMMRMDNLIHWEGLLMPTAKAGEFAELLAFFGRFGVSVDGDKGSLDMEKSASSGVTWYDAVRAAGLTAVAIPAFSEAYVAFGPHPDMPAEDDEQFAVMVASGDMVQFKRGPGWVTNPKETKRLHDYWTKPGQPGYQKIRWGTPGDFRRARVLIGEKIGANSPEDLRFLNQIIAQWHYDALGYWPGELGKPGNPPDTKENRRRAARHAASLEDTGLWLEVLTSAGYIDIAENLFEEARQDGRIEEVGLRDDGAILWTLDGEFKVYDAEQRRKMADSGTAMKDGSFPIADVEDLKNAIQAIGRAKDPTKAKAHIKKRAKALGHSDLIPESWKIQLVLTSSAGDRVLPPMEYFSKHPDTDGQVIEDPDEFGFRRTYGYAGEWGICHVGHDGQCTEVPIDPNGGTYPWFHLGRTKVMGPDGEPTYINTGLITYGKAHRSAQEILSETPTQAHYDDIRHAWAAVVLGEDERGVWYSGVVLPTVEDKWLTAIEASGQVSGEWKRGELRSLLTVNVAGFPVMRSSAVYDDNGELLALSASALSAPFEVCEPPEDTVCGFVNAAGVKCSEPATWGVWTNPMMYDLCCPNHVQALQDQHECPEQSHEPTAKERIEALALIDAEERIAAAKVAFALED
jgi:8-oxo-dGTP pyrophosphatase MutT (NUDIX family)